MKRRLVPMPEPDYINGHPTQRSHAMNNLPPGCTQTDLDSHHDQLEGPPECTAPDGGCRCPDCEQVAYEDECEARMDANREDGGSRRAPRRGRYD